MLFAISRSSESRRWGTNFDDVESGVFGFSTSASFTSCVFVHSPRIATSRSTSPDTSRERQICMISFSWMFGFFSTAVATMRLPSRTRIIRSAAVPMAARRTFPLFGRFARIVASGSTFFFATSLPSSSSSWVSSPGASSSASSSASCFVSTNVTSSIVGSSVASGMSSSTSASAASRNVGIPFSSRPFRTASSTRRSLVDMRARGFR